jgi:hypothetical protein
VSAIALRPRSPTEIIDAAFEILRREYLTLITIMAVIHLPLLGLQLTLDIDLSTPGKIAQNAQKQGWLSFLSLYALAFSTAAVIAAASDAYLGRKASVGDALGRMARRLFTAGFSVTVRFIVSYFFLIFILFPGLYLYSRWATLSAVIVLEDKGPFSGFGRAWSLAEDRVWASFLTQSIGFVIFFAIWLLWYGGVTLVNDLVPALARPGIRMAAQLIPVILFWPFIGVITTLMYYDLRIRKEAFDLEMMANELGTPGVGMLPPA